MLERLARIETPGEKWIRFLYAYPNRITGRLLDTLAEHAALVKYIDMPLQHSSASVLKRMKRGASGDIFLKLLERIRRTIPGVAIRTSMIVGFPGESDGDFEELCRFVEAARFDHLGVFTYSDEETSRELTVWTARSADGRSTIAGGGSCRSSGRSREAGNRRRIGQEVDVLVEGPSPETSLLWEARLATQAPEIDGVCLINDFEGDSAPAGPDPPSAHHRGARLRSGRDAAGRARAGRLPSGMKCPICKKEVALGDPHMPFCSERCRLIDLGNWATGQVRNPGAPRPTETEPDEGQERRQ